MKITLPEIRAFIFGRYGSLLLGMIVLLLYSPFVETRIGDNLLKIVFVVILLAGLRAINTRTLFFRIMIVILVIGLTCTFLGFWQDSTAIYSVGTFGNVLFLFLLGLATLKDLFGSKQVTGDTLAGAVCVYLLIAIVWAHLFLIVEFGFAGSFSFTLGEEARTQLWMSQDFFPFLYFSLVTLTTVGYGDMAPVSEAARTLATVEALIGQIYLTILVARLVGMYLVTQQQESDQ